MTTTATSLEDMHTFSWAIAVTQSSNTRVRRRSWPEDHWVGWMAPFNLTGAQVNERTKELWPEATKQGLHIGGYFVLFADDVWQPGWLATWADIQADDWIPIPKDPAKA